MGEVESPTASIRPCPSNFLTTTSTILFMMRRLRRSGGCWKAIHWNAILMTTEALPESVQSRLSRFSLT